MTGSLRRFLEPAPRVAPGERCELCADPIGPEHGHVIDLGSRALRCACRGCYLLFTRSGSGGNRLRSVPERYQHAPRFPAAASLWASAGIPVRMAFLFHNSDADRTVAFYPSPAGATESLLPLGAWDELLAAAPEFADIEDDVEALLLNENGDGEFEAFLVPVDACYELVGIVRTHWRGFDGGTEARQAIEAFFGRLRERAGG